MDSRPGKEGILQYPNVHHCRPSPKRNVHLRPFDAVMLNKGTADTTKAHNELHDNDYFLLHL